ncbi:flavodoxin domain-containing protein [Sulfitobacter aestuarii]|uniref:Flavodoxin domain-containing protein n=1 Tax=Sulfitobacter aestuarii TaxID=2161676 RepID=A0ABW5TYW0_9RHOB
MKILVAFATVEGQTRKIARHIQKELVDAGHEVELFDISRKTSAVTFRDLDRIILAGSVHERRHPQTFEVFLAAHRDELQTHNTLLLSVSLNAAFAEGREEAMEYVTELEMRTQFTPNAVALVAGAVKTGDYDYFATQVLRHVVLRGHDYDPADGEHEFTDWTQLAATLSDFMTSEDRTAPAVLASRR